MPSHLLGNCQTAYVKQKFTFNPTTAASSVVICTYLYVHTYICIYLHRYYLNANTIVATQIGQTVDAGAGRPEINDVTFNKSKWYKQKIGKYNICTYTCK